MKYPDLGSWVETGLKLHSGDRQRPDCGFCGSPLTQDRLQRLKAHFSDTFKEFTAKLDAAIRDIQTQRSYLQRLTIPDKSKVYGSLVDSFGTASQQFSIAAKKLDDYLNDLLTSLNHKREHVFEKLNLKTRSETPDVAVMRDAGSQIDELILRHNQQTNDFEGAVVEARKHLEEHYVAGAYEGFVAKAEIAVAFQNARRFSSGGFRLQSRGFRK